VSQDPRDRKPPLFRVFDRDPDRHRPVDGDYRQERLVRLHRPGPWRTAAVVAMAIWCAWVSLAAAIAVGVAQGVIAKSLVLLVGVVPVGLSYWLTARILTVGVYANDLGLRQNRVLSTTEADWADVVDVRRVPGQVPILGIGPRVAGERVVVVLADGDDILTTVTTHSPDFLLRAEAYDQAALAVERWWQESRPRG
jgi:hypothetical protein